MRFLIRYSSLSVAYYVACMLSLLLFTFLSMRTMEHDVEPLIGTGAISALGLAVCMGAATKFYWMPGYKFFRPTMTISLYALYLLWVFVPVLFNDIEGDSMGEKLLVLIRLTMPLFTLLITYNFMLNHGDSKWFGRFFCLMLLVYAYGFVSIMIELLMSGYVIQMGVAYFTLYTLPLVLLTCGKKTSIVFVVITLLVLVMSMKRGGVVALFAGLMAYGLTYILSSRKVSLAAIIGGALAFALFVGMFVYIGSSDEANIIERFEGAEDDEGSGRVAVWYNTVQLIENSDFMPLMFGHGYNMVAQGTIYGLSAHNDFLEVIYDYGVIGFILYLLAFCSLCFMVLRLVKSKSPYAPPMMMFLTVYFLLSMISHIIIYPWSNIILLTIAYVSAREKLDARNE